MKKWVVTLDQVATYEFMVEAEDEATAEIEAMAKFYHGWAHSDLPGPVEVGRPYIAYVEPETEV